MLPRDGCEVPLVLHALVIPGNGVENHPTHWGIGHLVLGISRLVTGVARQLKFKYPEGRNPGLTEESGCQWYKVLLKVSWALRSLITWGESFNPQCDEVLLGGKPSRGSYHSYSMVPYMSPPWHTIWWIPRGCCKSHGPSRTIGSDGNLNFNLKGFHHIQWDHLLQLKWKPKPKPKNCSK